MKTFTAYYSSPIGCLEIVATNSALTQINYLSEKVQDDMRTGNPITQETVKQLSEYFVGKRKTFTIPLSYRGTEFQNEVWDTLQNIPFGETTSYMKIAEQIARPRAIRAAGTAIGRNPIPIIIPCHRVLASNGKLGGFAWGLDAKRYLLAIEN